MVDPWPALFPENFFVLFYLIATLFKKKIFQDYPSKDDIKFKYKSVNESEIKLVSFYDNYINLMAFLYTYLDTRTRNVSRIKDWNRARFQHFRKVYSGKEGVVF